MNFSGGVSNIFFCYLKETKHLSLILIKAGRDLETFSGADLHADKVDRKSFSQYALILGGAALSLCSKEQSTVALSLTEDEYVAAALTLKEVLWIKRLQKEMEISDFIPSPLVVKIGNQAANSIRAFDFSLKLAEIHDFFFEFMVFRELSIYCFVEIHVFFLFQNSIYC